MNCAIHGVVHAYPHCVGSERDHSIQNEWLDTKEKKQKMEWQIGGEISNFSYFIKSQSQNINKVALDKETAISLPWKKFVFPDPLAPTEKIDN